MSLTQFITRLFSGRNEDDSVSLDRLLSLLPESPSSLAILAGAGISLNSPSNLLAGYDFMHELLRRVMPNDVPPKLIPSLISVPRNEHFRHGEFIRFETLMSGLVEQNIDPDLHVLDCLEACEQPNETHYVLAELLRRGAVVATTNFDRLIEIAYKLIARPTDPGLRVVYDDKDFPQSVPDAADERTLWKIHGSLTVDGRSTRKSLQATVTQILSPELSRNKRAFMYDVLSKRDLVLLGYSGCDDFDVVSWLANAPSARAMIWINHDTTVAPQTMRRRTASTLLAGQAAVTDYELVGRDRIFFMRGNSQRGASQHPENVVLVSANTAEVVDRIKERFCAGMAESKPVPAYQFGAHYPDAVRRFFDNWACAKSGPESRRYSLAIQLLSNREFRPEVAQVMQRLQARYRELISAPSAAPEERLDLLLDRFNKNPLADPSTSQGEMFYEDILAGLQEVSPLLSHHLQGTALRLSACVRWNKNEKHEGASLFRKAWELDRQSGLLNQEIATLTTWQRAVNSLADHLSHDDHEGLNAIATMMGDPTFPDEAFHRLQELANNTGYKMNLWNHLLRALQIGYAEEDPYRKRLVLREARSMTRAAVNMGDVTGEAKARLILAFALNDSGFSGEAAAHAVAVLELGRVVDLGDDGLRALAFLSQNVNGDVTKELRSRLAASMWA